MTLAAMTTVPLVTVTPCTVAVPLEEVRSTCTPLGASNAVVGVVLAPPRSSVTVTGLLGLAPLMACTAVETAVLDVVWSVTEPLEDDGALLTTDWISDTVAGLDREGGAPRAGHEVGGVVHIDR